MRSLSFFFIFVLTAAIIFVAASFDSAWAADYDHRFIRNYPPGYYGMYYNAERFFEPVDPTKKRDETYRWDKFMSRVNELRYPFYPIPYDWDYGTNRKFNLPDYNANNWW